MVVVVVVVVVGGKQGGPAWERGRLREREERSEMGCWGVRKRQGSD